MDINEFRQKNPEYNDMSDLDLANSLHSKFYSDIPASEFITKFTGKVPQDFMSKYLPSVKRTGEIFGNEVSQGAGALKEMYEEPTARSVGKGALGALQLAFSPLTAVAKGYVGEPVQRAAETAGLGKVGIDTGTEIGGKISLAELLGGMGENAAYMAPYGGLVKQAMLAKQAPSFGLLDKAGIVAPPKAPIGKNPLKYVTEPTPEIGAKFTAEGQLNKPVVQEGIQQLVAEDAVGAFQKIMGQKQALADLKKIVAERGMPESALPDLLKQHAISLDDIKTLDDKSKRVGQKIIDLVHRDEVDFKSIPGVLEKYDITPEQFAQELKNTYSTSGRTLARLSWTSKQLNKIYSETPETAKYFDEISKAVEPELTTLDKVYRGVYGVEQTRRALLVSQLATGMRNIESQTGRVGISAVEEGLDGLLTASVGGKGNYAENVGKGLDIVKAFVNKLNPAHRERVSNIINERWDDLVKMRYGSPATSETVTGKVTTKVFNALNNWQEFFFRRAALDAKLTQQFKKYGIPMDIAPKDIPEPILKEAVDYALEMTFAAMPKSKAGQEILRVFSSPFATMISNPFPRFAYANAIPFMVNFSPAGFLKAFKPSVVADLASGNPEKFTKAASRAVIGSTMLGTAMQLRANEDPSTKWYQISMGKDRYIDIRAFAPYSAYFLLAEAYLRPERLDVGDIGGAIIGLNRIAGTGLVLTDVMRSKSMEQAAENLAKLPGEYMGGFTVPARTVKDIVASVNPEEAKIRDRTGEGIMAPAKANIPFLSQTMPEAVTPLKTEPMRTETPFLRQTTGFSLTTKSPLQKEIDRLNLEKSSLFPRTGLPAADRMIVKRMAPIIEQYGTKLTQMPSYQQLTDTQKEGLFLNLLVNPTKQAAKQQLMQENPTLGLILEYEKQPKMTKELIKENPRLKELLESRGISTKKYLNQQKARTFEKSQYVVGTGGK